MKGRVNASEERAHLRRVADVAGSARPILVGVATGLAIIALVAAGYVVGYNRGSGPSGKAEAGGGGKTTATTAPPTGPGKDQFAQKCGSCHVLAAAGASGTAGPNLDQLQADEQTVLKQIEKGSAGMPAGLAKGKEAQDIAKFVAATAGG